MVAPCMGLMHESNMYPYILDNFVREVKPYTLGNMNRRNLKRNMGFRGI